VKFVVTLQVVEQVTGAENAITCRYEIEFPTLGDAISAMHAGKEVVVMRALIPAEPVVGIDHARD
jgi:hypothetical protein